MGTKVSALTNSAVLAPTDEFYLVQALGGPSSRNILAGDVARMLGVAVPDFQYIGTIDFGKWLAAQGVLTPFYTGISATQWAVYLTEFLLYCQMQFLVTMKNNNQSFDNLDAWSFIRARINIGCLISLQSPVIVPRYIGLDATGQKFIRTGSTGTVTSFYTGDPTTNACANVYQPLFQFAPGSHNIGKLAIQANSNGSDRGAGACFGRTWSFKSVATIPNAGNGYAVGDTITPTLGDIKSPYQSCTITVASISGGGGTGPIATVTFAPARWNAAGGVMGLPPAQQVTQWGSAGLNVLDPSSSGSTPVYKTTTSGTGTGATLTMNFWQDWESGNNTFQGRYSNYSSYPQMLGEVEVNQSSTPTNSFNATYGPIYGVLNASFESVFKKIFALGSDYAFCVTGSDCRGDQVNAVNSGRTLALFAGGSFLCPDVVSDTAFYADVEVDKFTGWNIRGHTLSNGSNASTKLACLRISQNDTTGVTAGLCDWLTYGGGATTPIPALQAAHGNANRIVLNVNNANVSGTPYSLLNSVHTAFGSGWSNTNIIEGGIDNVTGLPYTGVAAGVFNVRTQVQDAWPVTGRYYTSAVGNLGTANTFASTSRAGITAIPFEVDRCCTSLNLAFEITSAGSAGSSYSANMAIYKDASGLPGALIVDAGASGAGNVTITSTATGVFIQTIGGTPPTLVPGKYWLVLQMTAPTSGTPVLKALNSGSAGPLAWKQMGMALTAGSASPTATTGVSYVAAANSLVAFPASLSSISSPGYAAFSLPVVWVGF